MINKILSFFKRDFKVGEQVYAYDGLGEFMGIGEIISIEKDVFSVLFKNFSTTLEFHKNFLRSTNKPLSLKIE